jgi:two-component system chemotaxis response regulator CheB
MALRALIVDDTVTYRKILSDTISSFEQIGFTDTAPNGEIALKKISIDKPDIIFLDVHMPGMNGIVTLKKIKSQYPDIAVVMVSGISSRSTGDTIEALQIGAIDFIRKPDGSDFKKNSEQLHHDINSVLRFFELRQQTRLMQVKSPVQIRQVPLPQNENKATVQPFRPAPPTSQPQSFSICAIGVSTGGPEALSKLIPMLPGDFPIPIVLVQHMPPLFTKSLADSLTRRSKLMVIEGQENTPLEKGVVYIAPGGKHMIIRMINGKSVLGLNDEPPENSCRPSVDVLFRSVAAHYGDSGVLAIILTGMGNDGLNGIRSLKRKKCLCLTQSETTCVVYGMPRAIDEAGLSDKSLPIEMIAGEISSIVMKKNLAVS